MSRGGSWTVQIALEILDTMLLKINIGLVDEYAYYLSKVRTAFIVFQEVELMHKNNNISACVSGWKKKRFTSI